MRKVALALALIILVSSIAMSMTSCGEIALNFDSFFAKSDIFSNSIRNILRCFIPVDSDVELIDLNGSKNELNIILNNFQIGGDLIAVNKTELNFQAILSENSDFSFIADGNTKGCDFYTEVNNTASMFSMTFDRDNIKSGFDNKSFPFEKYISLFKSILTEKNYVSSEESFEIGGKVLKTDVHKLCFNSDNLRELFLLFYTAMKDEENKFISSYDGYAKLFADYVEKNKIHIEISKYYHNKDVVRLSLKVFNNEDKYIKYDLATYSTRKTSYTEFSITSRDSQSDFTIASFSIFDSENETKLNGKFDSYVIEIETKHDNNKSDSEIKLKVKDIENLIYNTYNIKSHGESITDEKNLHSYKVDFNTDENQNIILDAECKFTFCDSPEQIEQKNYSENGFNLSSQVEADNFLSNSLGNFKTNLETFKSNMKNALAVSNVEYVFDEKIIDNAYRTNGEFGKQYIDIFNSNRYTYEYSYPDDSDEHSFVECSHIKYDELQSISTVYPDYTERTIVNGNKVYYIQDDTKTVTETELTDDEIKTEFAEINYKYLESGKSEYNGDSYVYENYFDDDGYIYHFMFKDKELKIIKIMPSALILSQQTWHLFINKLTSDTPTKDEIFILPTDYKYE